MAFGSLITSVSVVPHNLHLL